MSPAPVKIGRIVRRLKGRSQAQLVQGENGKFYAAKFCGNPQGNRTLINEWVAHQLLSHLGVSSPRVAILELPQSSLHHEGLDFVLANRRKSPEGLFHFGSEYPANPETTATFDFLPAPILKNVHNLAQFAAMYVFDKWLGQTDTRQAIFIRDKAVSTGSRILKAYFIDHGMAFNGQRWEIHDIPLAGLAVQIAIYSMLEMGSLVEAAIEKIERIDREIIFAAMNGAHSSWFAPGDREAMQSMLIKLQRRQASLRSIAQRHLHSLQNGVDGHACHSPSAKKPELARLP